MPAREWPGPPPRSRPLTSVVTSKASERFMRGVLRAAAAQDARYRAIHVGTTRLPTGQTVLRVEFPAPSPLGLLG